LRWRARPPCAAPVGRPTLCRSCLEGEPPPQPLSTQVPHCPTATLGVQTGRRRPASRGADGSRSSPYCVGSLVGGARTARTSAELGQPIDALGRTAGAARGYQSAGGRGLEPKLSPARATPRQAQHRPR
jgi:hypothetical protein